MPTLLPGLTAGLIAALVALPPGMAAPAGPASPAATAAPTDRAADATPPSEEGSETDQAIASARRTVRATAEWLASGVDSWFGDKPFSAGGRVSEGRLDISAIQRQRESVDIKVRFNGRFRLPNLEQRTYLFVGRDNPREVISDKPGSFSRQQQLLTETNADRATFGGIGRLLSESVDLRLGLRGGLKPYVQARYRRPWTLGPADDIELRQTLFWSPDSHLGTTTAFSWQHAFTPALAGRWLNAATVTQTDTRTEWHSNLGAYLSLAQQRLAALELLATGRLRGDVAVTDYGLQLRWEQPLHDSGLLGEVIVGSFWPRADAGVVRRQAWAAGGGLKLRF